MPKDTAALHKTDHADSVEDQDDRGTDNDFSLDVDLPDDSLFTVEDYLDMYKTASTQPGFTILHALSEEGKLSTSELGMMLEREGNDLHYHLRKLKRASLIRNRRDPNTGTEEPYSYYELTDLGHIVLSEGLATGIKKLAAQEETISDQYSR